MKPTAPPSITEHVDASAPAGVSVHLRIVGMPTRGRGARIDRLLAGVRRVVAPSHTTLEIVDDVAVSTSGTAA